MQKLQKSLFWALILSETSHVFCCVLPTLFSLLSLLAGVGLLGTLPGWVEELHHTLHHWEVPMIAFSGAVLFFGWAAYIYSRRIDCHNTGCKHACNCSQKKDKANMILKIATVLFLINVTVFAVFHRGMDILIPKAHAESVIIVDIPACVTWKIEEIKLAALTNPPTKMRLWKHEGTSYYYITPHAGDVPSELITAQCETVCHPDGGFTGKGDGKCPEFVTKKQYTDALIWEDQRTGNE